LLAALLILLTVASGCRSWRQQDNEPAVVTSGSNSVSLSFSTELARSTLEGLLGKKLECTGELDPEVSKLLHILKRQGRLGRAILDVEDGRLVASRQGSTFRLQYQKTLSVEKLDATMPWAVAECLLGRSMTLDEALDYGRQPIKVKITGADGHTFEVRIDQ
jgi:hypothetical protein